MPEFEKVAFELEVSSTASPKWAEAKTSEGTYGEPLREEGSILLDTKRLIGGTGYHIIMVEGRK